MTEMWRVAWRATKQANLETDEDYLTQGAAKARAESLRQQGREVCEPYRIDVEEMTE